VSLQLKSLTFPENWDAGRPRGIERFERVPMDGKLPRRIGHHLCTVVEVYNRHGMALWQFNEADTTFLLEQLDNFRNVQGISEGTVRVDEATFWYGTRYVREQGALDKSCQLLEGREALDV